MEIIRFISPIRKKLVTLQIESLIAISIFFIFLLVLVILSFTNPLLFHTITENYNCTISFGIFVITLNTYSISKNDFLVLLGIGYLFVGLVDMFHAFAYSGVSILFQKDSANLTVQLWIAARYIENFTWLASTILIYKPVKTFKSHLILIFYVGVFTTLMLCIFYFKVFPTCFISNQGFTKFKLISEYIILGDFLLVAILYFRLRKKMDCGLFFYIECFLVIKIASELSLTLSNNLQDFTNIAAHILNAVAYYFIYKGVIELGLKRPYANIFHQLDNIGSELRNSNSELIKEKELHKSMEDILVRNEHCYDLIINNCSDAITVVSDDKFIFANRMAAKLLGTEKLSDIIGKEIENFVPPKKRNSVKQFIENINLTRGNSLKIETSFFTFEGKEIDVEVLSSYILYHGKPAHMNIFKDITSRKQINKLKNDIKQNEKVISETKEMNRLITEFYVNISHELKTPLNVIFGAIQILELPSKWKSLDPFEIKLNKYLKTMKQNCFRLLKLINNIIDSSKFDSGYSKASMCNDNIVSVIEDITLSVADYIQDKGLELTFDTNTEEKIMAIDIDKIERVILNLLSNAVKFTDKGDKIMVSLEDKVESVVISIKDTGVGIPEDKLNIIFERFGQVDKTLSRNHEGSGIGLTLVKSIIDMHNGTIRVESNLGKGCNFIIELPAKIIKEEKISENLLCPNNAERISIEFSDI